MFQRKRMLELMNRQKKMELDLAMLRFAVEGMATDLKVICNLLTQNSPGVEDTILDNTPHRGT